MRSILASLIILSLTVSLINAQAQTTSLGVCVNNANYCLYCTSSSTCGACQYGYVQSSSNAYMCVPCASSTSACATSASQQCTAMGFQSVGSTCVSCAPSSFANCSATCLLNGFYNNGTVNNTNGCAASNGMRVAAAATGPVSFTSCNQFGVFSSSVGNGQVSCQLCSQSGNNPGVYNCSSLTTALSCVAGYQLSNGQCIACSQNQNSACSQTCISSGFWIGTPAAGASNCTSCLSTTTACQSTCSSFGFYTSGTTCQACPAGTQVCALATGSTSVVLASICLSGYYLQQAGVCTACPNGQINCVAQLVNPTSCISQYFVNTTSTTCVACSGLLQICPTACLNQGFYTLSTTTGSTTTNTCTNCNSGSQIIATACSYNTVQSTASHSACISGYFLSVSSSTSIGTCTLCSASGASSVAANTCASSGFYYPTGSTGTSFTNCNVTWGASLSTSSGGVATCNQYGALSCQNGFTLMLSNNAAQGGSASPNYYGLFCVACATTTVSNSANQNNFYSCSAGGLPTWGTVSVSGCPSGYFYQTTNNTCMICSTNTLTCTSSTVSVSCLANYYLSTTTTCVACSSATTSALCSSAGCGAFYFNSQSNTCVQCPSQASGCTYTASPSTNPTTITNVISGCNSGYYRVAGTASTSSGVTSTIDSCSACPTGATACTYTTSATPVITGITCGNGYYYGQGQSYLSCQPCTGNAVSCYLQIVVSACQSGYYNNIFQCVTCINGASQSTNGVAVTCKALGSTLSGGSQINQDLTCQPGWYVATSGYYLGSCVSCAYTPYTITNGVYTFTGGCGSGCTSNGFYLSGNGQCLSCASSILSYGSGLAISAASSFAQIQATQSMGTSPGIFYASTSTTVTGNNGAGFNLAGLNSCALQSAICTAGYYLNPTTLTCTACPTGSYSDNTLATSISAYCQSTVLTTTGTYTYASLGASLATPTTWTISPISNLYVSATTTLTSCGAGASTCASTGNAITGITCSNSYYPYFNSADVLSCVACPTSNVFAYTQTGTTQCSQVNTIWYKNAGNFALTSGGTAITYAGQYWPYNMLCNTGFGVTSSAITNAMSCVACVTTMTGQTLANWASASATLIGASNVAANWKTVQSCQMNLGGSSALSALTCNTGYYHYNYASQQTPASTVTTVSICLQCPANAYSCVPGSGTAALTSTATIICNSGFTLIGVGYANTVTNGPHTYQCISTSYSYTGSPTSIGVYSQTAIALASLPSATTFTAAATTTSLGSIGVLGCDALNGLYVYTTSCVACAVMASGLVSNTCNYLLVNSAALVALPIFATAQSTPYGLFTGSSATTGLQSVKSTGGVIVSITCQNTYFPQVSYVGTGSKLLFACVQCPTTNIFQCTSTQFTDTATNLLTGAASVYTNNAICNSGYGISYVQTIGTAFACTACSTSMTGATLSATSLLAASYVSSSVKSVSCAFTVDTTTIQTIYCASGYYLYCASAIASNCICNSLPTGWASATVVGTQGSTATGVDLMYQGATLTCSSGYFLVQVGNYKTCAPCTGLSNTYTCLPTVGLTSCATGYYLSYTLGYYTSSSAAIYTCASCGTQVASCTYTAANLVTSITCNTGYYPTAFTQGTASSYSGATCSTCGTGAASCSSSACPGTATISGSCTITSLTCSSLYYLSSATVCTLCSSTIANAYTCIASNYVLSSVVCSNGYYSGGSAPSFTCTACSSTPTTCTSACLASGWYQPAVSSGSISTCTQCPGSGSVQTCGQSAVGAIVIIYTCAPTYYLVAATGINGVSQACSLVSGINNILSTGTVTQSVLPLSQTLTPGTVNQYSTAQSVTGTQQICLQGYGLTWSSNNVPSCTTCTSSSSSPCAYQCTGFANITNTAGSATGCVQCSNTNTLTCSSTLTTLSISCQNGYYVNNNGTCSSCPANTYQLSSSTTLYQTCNLGLALSVCASKYSYKDGACVGCASLGTACNGTCTTSGFFSLSTTTQTTSDNITQSVTTQTCTACTDANAISCQIASVSTSCASGYYLNQMSTCSVCQSGNSNILTCPVNVVPSICNTGFVLLSGLCVACPTNFATCTSSSAGTMCMPGFYLSGSSCTACPAGSLLCSGASTVQACISGYYPTSTNGTDGFDVTCNLCNATSASAQFASCASLGYVYSCNPGYYVNSANTACVGCPANGLVCNNNVLTQCAARYYVNTTANACNQCGSGAQVCTNSSLATQCLTGYAFATNGTCWSCSVISGCAACMVSPSTQQVVCNNCTGTATLSSGQCTCPTGQYQSGSGCSSCGTNCGACSNANTCSSCNSGYTASSGTNSCYQQCTSSQYQNGLACSNCPTNCTTNCSSSTVCKSGSCSSGYKYQSSTQTCQQNNSILLSILIIITMVLLI